MMLSDVRKLSDNEGRNEPPVSPVGVRQAARWSKRETRAVSLGWRPIRVEGRLSHRR
jgi:hypothetical protein